MYYCIASLGVVLVEEAGVDQLVKEELHVPHLPRDAGQVFHMLERVNCLCHQYQLSSQSS